jgi:predicted O-methyltransferase YrrM
MQEMWNTIDQYYTDLMLPEDPKLQEILDATAAAGLPAINVSPLQAKMLQLIVKMIGAKKILELGTLGGYSAVCMARALPEDGSLISLEVDPRWVELSRNNIERADMSHMIEIRGGKAIGTLPVLEREGHVFDLVFLDADKRTNPHYLSWAMRLTRPGSVIIADNVTRNGEVLREDREDPNVNGIRRYLEMAGEHPKLESTVIQTVGQKGYDGFCMSRVLA